MSQPLKYAWPAMVIKELEMKRVKEAWHKAKAEGYTLGDGVTLRTISHLPCAMFPEEDEERKRLNAIWEATKAASGG